MVIAGLVGRPYEPTPQNGRTDSQTGLDGDSSAWAPFALALAGLVGSVVAAVWLYRRTSTKVAYLLTTPALVVFAILGALSRRFVARFPQGEEAVGLAEA